MTNSSGPSTEQSRVGEPEPWVREPSEENEGSTPLHETDYISEGDESSGETKPENELEETERTLTATF